MDFSNIPTDSLMILFSEELPKKNNQAKINDMAYELATRWCEGKSEEEFNDTLRGLCYEEIEPKKEEKGPVLSLRKKFKK